MRSNWVILKFGGSSVARAKHWQTITTQINKCLAKNQQPLVVLSALKNVSNLLEALLHQALTGVHLVAIEHLKQLHLGFAVQIGVNIISAIEPLIDELQTDCEKIHQQKKISPLLHARVLANGELLSSLIGHEYFRQQGLKSHWKDVREVLTSIENEHDWHHYTNAECECEYNPDLVKQLSQTADVIVTQGFIAADKNNHTTLLGREGSDTSASYLAAILGAEKIEIWTDVSGIYSSNPKEIINTKPLPELNYQQAKQMANLGAKVLHPRTIQPALKYSIPIYIRNTREPENLGSIIKQHTTPTNSQSIFAVVYEPLVTRIELPNDPKQIINNKFLFIIDQFGLEQVLNQTISQQESFIFTYKDSDKAQISDEDLSQQLFTDFKTPQHSIQSGFSLVSVVGNNQSTEWMEDCKLWVQENKFASIYQIYDSKNEGRISFLCDQKNHLNLSQQLHDQFIPQ